MNLIVRGYARCAPVLRLGDVMAQYAKEGRRRQVETKRHVTAV